MAHMKAWHVVVVDGCKIKEDVVKYDVKEARELEAKKKQEYAETTYVVKREWY